MLGKWADLITRGIADENDLPIQLRPALSTIREQAKSSKLGTVNETGNGKEKDTCGIVNNFYNNYYNHGPSVQHSMAATKDINQTNVSIPSSPIMAHTEPRTQITEFVEWATAKHPNMEEAFEDARVKLTAELCELEAVRTMTDRKWRALEIPLGVGWKLTEILKEYRKLGRI